VQDRQGLRRPVSDGGLIAKERELASEAVADRRLVVDDEKSMLPASATRRDTITAAPL
jgi:hypothetical protein